jgi:glycosyltransferase involved in cell wall biosynthesis
MDQLVSVCIPTYNGERFIEAAIRSVVAQQYRPLELVISDDGSNDQTVAICERTLQATDCNWRVLHHAPRGMVQNWNFCIRQAQGAFIKFLFQDDLLEPDCITRMVALAQVDRNIGLVFSKRKVTLDPAAAHMRDLERIAGMIRDSHRQWPHLRSVQPGVDLLTYPRLFQSYLNKIGEPSCVMIRRAVLELAGFFNPAYQQLVDLEYWLRILMCSYIGFLDSELVTFRLHDAQQTLQNFQHGVAVEEWRQLLSWMWTGPLRSYLHPKAARMLRRKCLNHHLLPDEPRTLIDRIWQWLHWLRFTGISNIPNLTFFHREDAKTQRTITR